MTPAQIDQARQIIRERVRQMERTVEYLSRYEYTKAEVAIRLVKHHATAMQRELAVVMGSNEEQDTPSVTLNEAIAQAAKEE